MDLTPDGIPVWVQWIRKVIIEDGHNVAQLVSIYQLIIRNSSLFFSCREHFLLNIVGSLAKLGLSGNTSSDNRLLTIDLGELLLKWDKQEREEGCLKASDVKSASMDVDGVSETINYKEMAINYMIRFCLSLHDPQTNKGLISRALEILRQFMTVWPDAPVRLLQLEKIAGFNFEGDSNFNLAFVAAEVLKISVETKSEEWICGNLSSINKCIQSWITSENPSMTSIISACVLKIYNVLDKVSMEMYNLNEKNAFSKTVDNVIAQGLRNLTNIACVKEYLAAAYLNRPNSLGSNMMLKVYINDIIKLTQNLISDALNTPLNVISESNTETLKTFIWLLNTQISNMGEARKVFIQSLSQIIEIPGYIELHRVVLNMLREWIFEEFSFPTMKEKAAIALKMMILEKHSNSDLFEQFLGMVADIYESDKFIKTDLTVKLENAFLIGTTVTNHVIRERFCKLFDKSISTNPSIRIRYIFGSQNWEGLANHFWIRQALDLLFGSIISSSSLIEASSGEKLRSLDFSRYSNSMDEDEEISEVSSKALVSQKEFLLKMQGERVESIICSLRGFIHENPNLIYSYWTELFPLFWNTLNGNERHDIVKDIITLVAHEYHLIQADMRPNVIQAILEGICKCSPILPLPPQLVR